MTVEEVIEILEQVLIPGSLNRVQEIVLRQSWAGRSYAEIATLSGYDIGYIKDTGSKLWQLLSTATERKVTKNNLQIVLKHYVQEHQLTPAISLSLSEAIADVEDEGFTDVVEHKATNPVHYPHQDWGEAIDVTVFYGRATELLTLQHWIVQEHCRLVTILGIGGIGKTALAIKLAEQIKANFDYVIWRSLRNAPPAAEMLTTLISFISNQQEIDSSESIDGKISQLLTYLRSSRCLIILDNLESILQSGYAGRYRSGYEGYGQLIRCLGETPHRSCLVLTSREKPKGLASKESKTSAIRSLQLTGLQWEDIYQLFATKDLIFSGKQEVKLLTKSYAGNPLALQMVSAAIQDVFERNTTNFIAYLQQQGCLIFNDIRNLLERQLNRLSELEQEVMYWLAIEREQVAFTKLYDDLVLLESKQKLLDTLSLLKRRSLVEVKSANFNQQPVVMEYITEKFVTDIYQEIDSETLNLFNSHALIQAQAKDYIRNSQINIILEPLIAKLRHKYKTEEALAAKLNRILLQLHQDFQQSPGYGCGNLLNLFRQLRTNLTGYDFSDLTVWQAYLPDVNLHHVSFANSDLSTSVFSNTFSSVFAVAFSPDGELLATSGRDNDIKLWQVANNQQLLLTCNEHQGSVFSITFSPDSQMLASSSNDCTVKLWDVTTGSYLKTLQENSVCIHSVAFSPDGQILAGGSDDGTVKLWDVATGRCLKALLGHNQSVRSVAFSPDGQTLASGSEDTTIKLWDVATGCCCQTLSGHHNWIHAVAFSSDGQILASGSEDAALKLWDVTTGCCCQTLSGHTGAVWSVAFAPSELLLASSSSDHNIKLWNIRTGKCIKTLSGHFSGVFAVSFSPNGNILCSGSLDQSIKLWEIATGQCIKTWQGQTNWISAIAFSADGQILASNQDKTVKIWDLTTSQVTHTLQAHTSRVWSIAFSPYKQLLASGSEDQTIRLWNVVTGHCLQILAGHTSRILSLAFTPPSSSSLNRQILASGGEDKIIRLWDVATGHCRQLLQGHTSRIWSLSFTPDGQTLISSSGDGTIKLWNALTGKTLRTISVQTSQILSIAVSPDGSAIASSNVDNTISLWQVSTGKCLKSLSGHSGWIVSVSFSPDGTILSSGSLDCTVKLWDVATGKCLHTLPGHDSWVWSVAFKPSDRLLASGSQDETIRLWDSCTGEGLQTLKPDKVYAGMDITGATGLTTAQTATLKMLGAVEHICDVLPTQHQR